MICGQMSVVSFGKTLVSLVCKYFLQIKKKPWSANIASVRFFSSRHLDPDDSSLFHCKNWSISYFPSHQAISVQGLSELKAWLVYLPGPPPQQSLISSFSCLLNTTRLLKSLPRSLAPFSVATGPLAASSIGFGKCSRTFRSLHRFCLPCSSLVAPVLSASVPL